MKRDMAFPTESPGSRRTRVATGVLLVLAGLSLVPVYISDVLALPFFLVAGAGSYNEARLVYVGIGSLLFLGPAVLMLGGVAMTLAARVRLRWLVGIGVVGVVALAIWASLTSLGELPVTWFVAACAVAVTVGVFATYFVKRAWLAGLIGAVFSAPLLLRAVSYVLRVMFSTQGVMIDVAALAAVLLWLASLICTIRFRFR